MLCLLGVMLSVLCLVFSTPVPTHPACPNSTLFKETIQAVRKLSSERSSEVVLLNKTMKAGGNAATYLEGFSEALKNSKENVKLRDVIVANLQKIQSYGKSCTGWMSALKEHQWEPVEEKEGRKNFFKNLDYFLRFLGEKADPEEKI